MNDEAPRSASLPPPPDDQFAAGLRGFGPLGIVAIVVVLLGGNAVVRHFVVPVGGIFALIWVRLSRTPWREIGYVRPKSWIGATAIGVVVFGVAFKFLMKAIVMPLLGADPVNQAYHDFAANRALIPAGIWMGIAAGFGEETVYRGYMFERLGKLFGSRTEGDASGKARSKVWPKVWMTLITSAWFSLGHYANLGLTGVEQAMMTGLTFGTIYAVTGRVWIPMCAHAGFDLASYAIIYWELETTVAHLVFK